MLLSPLGLLAPVAVAASAAVLAGGASAAPTDVSANWAGYVVTGVDSLSGGATSYTNVSATWTQPAAKCSSTAVTGSTASAFWIGLGGDADTSQSLEQAGTEADCGANGMVSYSAWYELVPAASVKVNLKVDAGDKVSGAVHVNGTQVTVQLKNLTRQTSFTKKLRMAAPDLSSAEWIAEAPAACSSYGRCQETSLTDFGTVKFSGAKASTSDGQTGTISDPAWTADQVTLDSSAGGGGPFDRFTTNESTQATPSTLSTDGSSFSITWATASSSSTDPSAGAEPGFGDGGAYPGGGYAGSAFGYGSGGF